jgi:hypothetical protein
MVGIDHNRDLINQSPPRSHIWSICRQTYLLLVLHEAYFHMWADDRRMTVWRFSCSGISWNFWLLHPFLLWNCVRNFGTWYIISVLGAWGFEISHEMFVGSTFLLLLLPDGDFQAAFTPHGAVLFSLSLCHLYWNPTRPFLIFGHQNLVHTVAHLTLQNRERREVDIKWMKS